MLILGSGGFRILGIVLIMGKVLIMSELIMSGHRISKIESGHFS